MEMVRKSAVSLLQKTAQDCAGPANDLIAFADNEGLPGEGGEQGCLVAHDGDDSRASAMSNSPGNPC